MKRNASFLDLVTTNRWSVMPFATVVTGSIGAIYCWSMWTTPLTTLLGVVAQAPDDFTLPQVLPVLSAAAICFGMTTSGLGTWVERVGPVKAGTIGSVAWCTSLLTCAAGAHLHMLPLIYLGYGAFGGLAWGCLYLSPVTTTMKWFPDSRGLATGITLSAFGLGAAVAPVIIDSFTQFYFVAPEFAGLVADVALLTLDNGSQVLASDPTTQVVVATAADAAKVGMTEGVYLVGTGDSGATGAFATLGCLYGAVGVTASQFMKGPPAGWVPDGFEVDQESTKGTLVGVPVHVAIKTPQFALLWCTVLGNAVGGMAIISSSKVVMMDIWSGLVPGVVTAGFATAYVAALGGANSMGRLGWAIASDKIGRKNAYSTFAVGIPIMASTPFLIEQAMSPGWFSGSLPLGIFVGGTFFAIVNYGGIFSVLPAYIADLWGQKHSSSLHGALLTAWSTSAVLGPLGLGQLRKRSEATYIDDLITHIEPSTFADKFGATIEHKDALLESHTLTISRLMEVMPAGITDPTPHLYDTTFYAAAGFLGIAAVCNQLLTPPDVQALLKKAEEEAQKRKAEEITVS